MYQIFQLLYTSVKRLTEANIILISESSKLFFLIFVMIMSPFCGATGTLCFDFWVLGPWVLKPEWMHHRQCLMSLPCNGSSESTLARVGTNQESLACWADVLFIRPYWSAFKSSKPDSLKQPRLFLSKFPAKPLLTKHSCLFPRISELMSSWRYSLLEGKGLGCSIVQAFTQQD